MIFHNTTQILPVVAIKLTSIDFAAKHNSSFLVLQIKPLNEGRMNERNDWLEVIIALNPITVLVVIMFTLLPPWHIEC